MPLDRGFRTLPVSEKKPMDEVYIQAIKDETAKYKAELERVKRSIMEETQLKNELNKQVQDVRLTLIASKSDLETDIKNKTKILDDIECKIRSKHDEISAKNEEIFILNEYLKSTQGLLCNARNELSDLNLTIHDINNEKTRQASELQAIQNSVSEALSQKQVEQALAKHQLDEIKRQIETRRIDLSGVLNDIADRSNYCDVLQAKLNEMQTKLKSESERLLKLNQLNETIERDKLENTERGRYLHDWSQRLSIDEKALKNRMADLIKREQKLKEAMKT